MHMNKLTLLTIVKINWFNMLNLIFILDYVIQKLWEEVDLGNCVFFLLDSDSLKLASEQKILETEAKSLKPRKHEDN